MSPKARHTQKAVRAPTCRPWRRRDAKRSRKPPKVRQTFSLISEALRAKYEPSRTPRAKSRQGSGHGKPRRRRARKRAREPPKRPAHPFFNYRSPTEPLSAVSRRRSARGLKAGRPSGPTKGERMLERQQGTVFCFRRSRREREQMQKKNGTPPACVEGAAQAWAPCVFSGTSAAALLARGS
jgi:hypothetical protein